VADRATTWRIRGGGVRAASVPIAGYKHALVPMICMGALFPVSVEIRNVPDVLDTAILCRILERFGAEVELRDGTLRLETAKMTHRPIPDDLSAQIHGSVYLLPALLARFGVVDCGPSGGCQIGDAKDAGARPIQHMVSVLERFGAKFDAVGGRLVGRCDRLRGAVIDIMDYSQDPKREALEGPYHSGATKTAVMAAVVAEGATVIENPHDKEATLDLLAFLRAAGASIDVEPRRFVIQGGTSLRSVVHSLLSDTTEMVTFIAHAVHARAPLRLERVTVDRVTGPLRPELDVLRAMGVELAWEADAVTVTAPERLRAADVKATGLGVATDSQPFFTLMLTAADGVSRVSDGIWGNRFGYVEQLVRLGADLRVDERGVEVRPGRPGRAGQTVDAGDTRAAAVLALAAAAIPGETVVRGVHHAARGYHELAPKLRATGVVVEESSG